jgi:hypothetical protein
VIAAWVAVFAFAIQAHAQTSAPGWTVADVGEPASTGTATFGPDALTVTSTGADIAGLADQFTFVYRPIIGNAAIVARIDSVQALDAGAQAGVMIRESLAADASTAFIFVNGNRATAFRARTSAGRPTTEAGAGSSTASAVWLKLQRAGAELIASRSIDGVTWTVVSSSTSALPETVFVGLAVASHSAPSWIAAGFSNVRVIGSGTLDDGFSAADVGSPSLTGGSWGSDGTFVIDGSGQGIGGSQDQFRFVYRPFAGDADVMTRVAAFETGSPDARAGIVVRSGLDATSPYAAVLVSPRGVEFASRSSDAEPAAIETGGSISASTYLRLRRTGNTVTGLRSPDGIYWSTVGQKQMTAELGYIGVAATSGDPRQLAHVRFDNTIVAAVAPARDGSTPLHSHLPTTPTPPVTPVTPSGPPDKVIFVPSTIHDEVARYVLEVFLEGADPTTARALAIVDLGKPEVTLGECAVDIAARILALAPGRYVATVTAIVLAEGNFRSDPSPVFTR